MLSGIESKRILLFRHVAMAGVSVLLVYLFYLSYSAWGVEVALWPDWGEDHPFWRAWAHAAFVLLFLVLILSPASTLWRPVKRFLPWRRELGIWFAVLSLGHAYAIWDRWARWDVAALFGFEYVEQLGSYVLFRPEVGIMNMMGVIVLPMILLLGATSFDRAVTFLGASSWKWIHRTLVPAIFYIIMLRGVLYFFYFFQTTPAPPEWRVYPSIWFLYVFLGMGIAAVCLQAAAFAKIVLQRRARNGQTGLLPAAAVTGVAVMLVMPLVLMTGFVGYFDARALDQHPAAAQAQPPPADEAQEPREIAQSFEMVIHVEGEDLHLWVRDLDEAPYFRLSTEVAGSPVSHQIYRYSDRTLHTAEQGPDGEFEWSIIEGVGPDDIGLAQMTLDPGGWAAEYGPGEHQIQLPDGQLDVTIHSVEEPIPDEVFEVPEDAEPVSRELDAPP